jgi:hypothetical protein
MSLEGHNPQFKKCYLYRMSPRRRWEDNIKMDLQAVGWVGMDWIWLRIGTGGGLL